MKNEVTYAASLMVVFGLSGAVPVTAGEKSVVDACVKAAQGEQAGEMVKMEKKTEGGKTVYEFEIQGKDQTREFECDAATAKIIESEVEVDSPDEASFKLKARLTPEQARDIALKKHPGTIVETEYEIESDGRASYEFDISKADGQEVKIEIDAETGKIVEDDQKEIYQIGRE